MAPLPQNNTARILFDYVTGNSSTSVEHTVAVRYDPLTTPAGNMQGHFYSVLNALGPGRFRVGWRVVRVRTQAAGANFSLPTDIIPPLDTFVGTLATGYVPRVEAVESTFQGRSFTSGRRVDFSLYRAAGDAEANFRVPGGEAGINAAVTNVVTTLNGFTLDGQDAFITIDGSPATWYNYMNEQYNSYWEEQLRTS